MRLYNMNERRFILSRFNARPYGAQDDIQMCNIIAKNGLQQFRIYSAAAPTVVI